MNCRVELLHPSMLEQNKHIVREINKLRLDFGLDLGWHYMLDLVWILKHLESKDPSKVLDAGAGKGLLQYALAERGHDVISLDFRKRQVPLYIRAAYQVEIHAGKPFRSKYLEHMKWRLPRNTSRIRGLIFTTFKVIYKLFRITRSYFRLPCNLLAGQRKHKGVVHIVQGDMTSIKMIDDKSLDIVVSLSAFEHLDRKQMREAMREINRVVKPNGQIIVTTSAGRDDDYFHQPSMGWCFSEASILEIFGPFREVQSNWQDYEDVMNEIRASQILKQSLSFSYKLSGENGMPWGKWDPQYLPVGIYIREPGSSE